MIKNMEEIWNLREKYEAVIDLTKLILLMLYVSHCCACAWYYVGATEESFGW